MPEPNAWAPGHDPDEGKPRRKKMNRREAGRLGGEKTKRVQLERDPEYYRRIGRLGGGKGGETTKARYGSEHYARIARKARRAEREQRRRTSSNPAPAAEPDQENPT